MIHLGGGGNALFSSNCDTCGSIPIYADYATYVVSTVDRVTAQIKISDHVIKIKDFITANNISINLGKWR